MIFIVLLLFLITGCSDMDLPELPDNESVIDDAIVLDLDIAQTDDDDISEDLIVATVGGYDVPFSGRVYFSVSGAMDDLIPVKSPAMGSAEGSDLALSVWDKGFFVIGRYDSSRLYFFKDDGSGGFDPEELDLSGGKVLNLQDGVYNPLRDEFIVSALNSSSLIIIKDGEITELKISENENASPAKMRIIGGKLYVAMQNLDEKWRSQAGQVAVVGLDDHDVSIIDLPVMNPVGKIEYNGSVDPDHFYIACAGGWQKRDGAILRVDLETGGSQIILSESGEEGSLLDGDMVDVSLAGNGDLYLVFSNNSDRWTNRLLKYETLKGRVSMVDSGLNAFAANPVEYSAGSKKVYYFADEGPDTYLKSIDTVSGEKGGLLLKEGPAAVKVRVEYE